ncbi:hypothetical protein BDQ17DRAFT_1321469 [Cyathus striatus]|nr:hypothetical protein BDQ17DRAFT_1321469 [Cyathus striatus]
MSKRSGSPPPLPPPKRVHIASPQTAHHAIPFSFDNSFYDELILCIFSHLSWIDLCSAQATNRNWARLATDNELWRKLYLKIFGRTRLRGVRGFIGRMDGREIKPLPGRAKADDLRDWKWMFRISSNWRRGRCSVEQLPSTFTFTANYDEVDLSTQTHILLAGSLTITASSRLSNTPVINISGASDNVHSLVCQSSYGPSHLTALAVDQSPPVANQIRLAAFLATGEFVIFLVNHFQPSPPIRKLTYIPPRRSNRTSPIVQAVYHHPLLITLSQSFTISIYDLSRDSIRHSQSLSSFTSFPPASLVLSTQSSTNYKLVIAYALPVYPTHWSVGATELIIAGPSTPEISSTSTILPASLSFTRDISHPTAEPMTVIATRTARAIDVPQGWMDENKLRAMREQWSRKVAKVVDTQTDGKWVVVAPGDQLLPYTPRSSSSSSASLTSPSPFHCTYRSSSGISSSPFHSSAGLQLYRLSLPSSSSVSAPIPKLTFVRTLHGQSGPVTALALADGRCVSLGYNGSIWVWDLEGGTGAEVAGPQLQADESPSISCAKGTVAFDERRILTAHGDDVVVRRFDV